MEPEGSLLCSKSPPMDPILSLNPVYTLPTHLFKIHSNVILLSTPISVSHRIQFHDTCNLTMKPRRMRHIIREATEVGLHHDNMNREVMETILSNHE